MYLAWFGLLERPFAITPDPRYLYLSARHAEALAHLLYGLTDSGGFIQLTGEVGTGKTTLVRKLLDQLPEGVDVALVLNPRMSPLELVRTIAEELGATPAEGASLKAHVDALNQHLLDAHARGRRSVLIMDEAQTASSELLEQLRLLTNLETPRAKLLQIILIGQPELRDTLARRELRQLAQRITARYHLEPLTRGELDLYVRHRLEVAGAPGAIFDAAALDTIFERSEGIPRLANVICDRALLGAYAAEVRQVDRDIARRAADEVLGGGGPALPTAQTGSHAWLVLSLVGLLCAGGAGALWWQGHRPASPEAPQAAAIAVPPPLVAAPAPESPPLPLAERLATGGLASDTDSAFARLFAAWDLALGVGAPPCAQAETHGLRCHVQRGDWETLRRLDRPVILNLEVADGTTHQAVLRALSGDRARLEFGDETVEATLAEIDGLWFGEHLVLWQMPPHGPAVQRPGYTGPAIRWLREQLARHRGLDPDAQSDVYDDELKRWVAEFQAARGLKVDGYTGEQTLMHLDAVLRAEASPSLTET